MAAEASRSSPDVAEIVFFALTVVLAGIHLYLGLIDPASAGGRETQFLLVGIAFLAGIVLRVTPFWRPILYILGAGFALYLGVIWFLAGGDQFVAGIATGVVSVAFMTLAVYLFVRTELSSAGR